MLHLAPPTNCVWHRFAVARCTLLAALACVSIMAGCRSTAAPKPLDQLTADERMGHAVFVQHCSTCHHDRTADALNGPGLAGLYKKPYLPSGAPANDDRVRSVIVHGRNMMPPQGWSMTDDELNHLLLYLHTL